MITFSLLLVSLICSCSADFLPGVATTEVFGNSKVLDAEGHYLLFWNFNDSHVTFEVHVKTKGWVGFGLSSNGNMFPGDVVIGWVNDDGATHFSDRHTVGHSTPIVDKSQDWHLLLGKEDDFGTVLKFVRKIITCDEAEDQNVEEGTSRVIFAYGSSDPVDEQSIPYHGTTRGTKSVELLRAKSEPPSTPTQSRHVDFFNHNYVIPSRGTTYLCSGFVMPKIEKHNIIKFEVVVTPGNEMNVHHIVLYRCAVANPEQWDGKQSFCYSRNRKLPRCEDYFLAWAIGGEPFYFPDNVGFPIGGPDDDGYLYIMETHYDNPQLISGMIDNSGLRFTMTTEPREYEAGLLTIGHSIGKYQVIPPGQDAFNSRSYCSEECMDEGFTQSNSTEIKVIGVFQHAHLLGTAITTRHFRNGTELKPLIEDPHYDFNFQQIRALPKQVSVYPGDSFEVDCIYNSTKRTLPTTGGLTTRDEMCLAFTFYYPRIKLTACQSTPTFSSFSFNAKDLKHVLETSDWSNKTFSDSFAEKIEKSDVYQVCYGQGMQTPPVQVFPPYKNEHPYVRPTPDCS